MEELSRLGNTLQYSFPILHHGVGNVRTEHQAKVPHVVHLTKNLQLLLVTTGVPSLYPWLVERADASRLAPAPEKSFYLAEVGVPIDDNDIEGRRRYVREDGCEEPRRGVLRGID